MTVLVDPARWPWRGRLWAHLVSDHSLGELHRFATDLGLPRRAFQGDHYDVPAEYRERALRLGALAVDSRELVRRLRASGLRCSPTERRQLRGQVGPGGGLPPVAGPVRDEQSGPGQQAPQQG